jgi:hypothetical protein
MVGNFVCACHGGCPSGAERRAHGSHDLWCKERCDQAKYAANHACLAEFLAPLATDHVRDKKLQCAGSESEAARAGAIARGASVKLPMRRKTGVTSIGELLSLLFAALGPVEFVAPPNSAGGHGRAYAERAKDDAKPGWPPVPRRPLQSGWPS